jgi:hypothetical protein
MPDTQTYKTVTFTLAEYLEVSHALQDREDALRSMFSRGAPEIVAGEWAYVVRALSAVKTARAKVRA